MSLPRVLFVAANAHGSQQLDLDREYQLVHDLVFERQPRALEVVPGLAASVAQLIRGISKHKPTIVHFAGHGGPDGTLCFRDDDGSKVTVQPAAIRKILTTMAPSVRVIVLNSCYSDVLGKDLLSGNAVCVIGSRFELPDRAALEFSRVFYDMLCGESLNDAVEAGKAVVETLGPEGGDLFRAHYRDGIDPRLISFAPRASAIGARFHLDDAHRPICGKKHFEIELYLKDASDDITEVFWALDDASFKNDDWWDVSDSPSEFAIDIRTYGDFPLEAVCWRIKDGFSIRTRLAAALRAEYGASATKAVRKAIDSIATDGRRGGYGTRPRRASKKKLT